MGPLVRGLPGGLGFRVSFSKVQGLTAWQLCHMSYRLYRDDGKENGNYYNIGVI